MIAILISTLLSAGFFGGILLLRDAIPAAGVEGMLGTPHLIVILVWDLVTLWCYNHMAVMRFRAGNQINLNEQERMWRYIMLGALMVAGAQFLEGNPDYYTIQLSMTAHLEGLALVILLFLQQFFWFNLYYRVFGTKRLYSGTRLTIARMIKG